MDNNELFENFNYFNKIEILAIKFVLINTHEIKGKFLNSLFYAIRSLDIIISDVSLVFKKCYQDNSKNDNNDLEKQQKWFVSDAFNKFEEKQMNFKKPINTYYNVLHKLLDNNTISKENYENFYNSIEEKV